MRKLILISLAIVILVCSCATGTDITEKNSDGSPIWTTEIPKSTKYLYGVGRAKLLMESNSQQAADAAARSDLALKIRVNMKDALAMYSDEASNVVVSAFETLIVQSVNLTMNKVVVEQRWTAPDGTVWSLVSFRVKDLPDLYADAANDYLNQLEEKRISTEKKLAELLEDFKDSTDETSVEYKRLAQEKADSIISEVNEIEGRLDNIPAQVGDIVQYLLNNGYELED